MSPHNLPFDTTSFIGRENELAKIADLLALPDCRLVTLTGSGGIGKTRLALQAVAEQQLHFEHGVHFIPLTSINSADLVPAAIAATLQVSFHRAQDFRVQIIHYLREKHMLLVMDNFEHVLEATDLLTELLQAAPDLKCLVTSREVLNLREEWAVMLEGLPFPGEDANEPRERYSAVQLFLQRARQVEVNFSLEENLEAVQAICQRVEGMPLAIELASTWLRAMSCRQIAVQLADSLNFLTTSLRNVPERHRSMRAVFEHSWKLLSGIEQHALMYLSVFRGGFDRDAAEQVAGASLPVLASLADKSMIRLNAAERYDLHELLRQYAADKLAEVGEGRAANQCHFDYFLKLAEAADAHSFGREQIAWFDRVVAELDNLRVAAAWSVASETGLRFCGLLGWVFTERALTHEGRGWLERAIAANPDADASIRSRAFHTLAALTGRRPRTQTLCDEALALARMVDDRWNMAWALSHRGIYGGLKNPQSAEDLRESVALFREINDPMGLAHNLVRQSFLAMRHQDHPQARLLLEEAGMLAHQAGDAIITGWVMHNLGMIAWQEHDLEQARLQFVGALINFTAAQFKYGIDNDLMLLGAIEQASGNLEQARTFYQDALLSMCRTSRSDRYVYLVLRGLSTFCGAIGQIGRNDTLFRIAAIPAVAGNVKLTERLFSEKDESALREVFGEDLFARLLALGHNMTLDQAKTFLVDVVAQFGSQAGSLETAGHQQPLNDPLTEREQEILHLIADGLNSRQIAERLVLSVGTVRWYRKHIYSKLDTHSRAEALARARELNLLT